MYYDLQSPIVNIILSVETVKPFRIKSGTRQVHLLLLLFFQHCFGGPSKCSTIKSRKICSQEKKKYNHLLVDNGIAGNYKLLELTRDFNRVTMYKINI